MEKALKNKLWPLTLSAFVILLDQFTKALVVKNIPRLSPYADDCVIEVIGKYFRLIHVRNKAVAFSMGSSLPQTARGILFAIIPLVVIGIIYSIYFKKTNEFTKLQCWSICGILGGGIGNLIDRFFRPDGVVDFFDCYFFGLFGMERWPTFNVADCAVVICGILFVISILISTKKTSDSTEDK